MRNPFKADPKMEKFSDFKQWEWRGVPVREMDQASLVVALEQTLEQLNEYRAADYERHKALTDELNFVRECLAQHGDREN